jgi:hypothetical protein
MINPARMLKTLLLILSHFKYKYNVFLKKKCVSIQKGEMGFLEDKIKRCFDEMDGCFLCEMS